MRIAILATIVLWALIFGLIYLCFPTFGFAQTDPYRKRTTIIMRTYYKPGYQSLNLEQAEATARIAIRRTERLLPVRFSHTFREIGEHVVPHERDFEGCYRIPSFEDGACCPSEYIARYWEQTDIYFRNKKYGQVSIVIAPPVGGNDFHNGHWLSGGIAYQTCFGQKPNISLGVINATAVNKLGEQRVRSMAELYRHELHHAAFNASHQEFAPDLTMINVMGTWSPYYNHTELMLGLEPWLNDGLPTRVKTGKEALDCIFLYRKQQKERNKK